MCEEEIDLDEHWSYTIMGNWRAKHYYQDLFFICWDAKTDVEKMHPTAENQIFNSMRALIAKSYNELISFVQKQRSRLAYLVLGWFLMFFGGRMTDEIKDQILKYSAWKYEESQFKNENERELRKKYLSEFRERIKDYNEGTPLSIAEESLSDIYYNDGPWDLTPINYDLE